MEFDRTTNLSSTNTLSPPPPITSPTTTTATMMLKSPELPDLVYVNPPVLIRPANPTPKHSIYLSNLDDQSFLRFSIKYVFVFQKGVSLCKLKRSLAIALENYYPLAGRLRVSGGGPSSEFDRKLEVECNGEGAVFVEGFMDFTAEEFLQTADTPNRSWRKLLHRYEASSFLDIPPLIVQVTNLSCGGMILCTGINHCLSDGVGTSQFLHAWAHITTKPNLPLPIKPFHFRHVFKPRNPLHVTSPHPQYSKTTPSNTTHNNLLNLLRSLPLRPVSVSFSAAQILRLKRRCIPSLKCTTFEALAAHTWQCWLHSLTLATVVPLPPSLPVNLLFSVNVRHRLLLHEPPSGFYGNAFVLACAQSSVKELNAAATSANIHHGVTLVQQAKAAVTDEYVRSVVDMLDDRSVRTDMSASLVISQWSKLGLEDLDFGEGKAVHMGPLASDIYCLFLPVAGDVNAVRVLVSVPECVAHKFEVYMKDCCYSDDEDEDRINNDNGEQNSFI